MNVLKDYDPSDDLIKLGSTDLQDAQLKRAVDAHDYIAKKVKQEQFLKAEGSVAERTAIAESSKEYQAERNKYFEAIEESTAMQNMRKTCILRIDVWRSLNANRRQG